MSMLYDITLAIRYTYAAPAASARTLLRMLPLSRAEQRLITGLVEADPRPDYRTDGVDFFGNAMTEMAYDGRLSDVTFRFTGRVERDTAPRVLDLSCPIERLGRELTETATIAPQSPHHFLGPSERIGPAPDIAAFARETCAPGMSTLAVVQALSTRIHDEFTFDPKATDVGTSPAEAFRNRRGVCQDFSHVMISALRAIDIPAAYVSGFLRTTPPPGRPRLEGADAMHAWVRAWCGQETGWVEFDPTNDVAAGQDHVSVAIGRDYADVAPVKGSLRTAGPHKTEHSVDVVPVLTTEGA